MTTLFSQSRRAGNFLRRKNGATIRFWQASLSFCLLLFICSSVFATQKPAKIQAKTNEAASNSIVVQEAIRGILRAIEQAVNNEQFADIGQYFHPKMRATLLDQQTLSARSEIEPYFKQTLGPDKPIRKLNIQLGADASTDFLSDDSGIIRGSCINELVMADGRQVSLPARWTATIVKTPEDSKWRILYWHIGANVFDNPLLVSNGNTPLVYIGYGVGGGLLLGLFIGWFWRRDRF